jgi:hypothetical protein
MSFFDSLIETPVYQAQSMVNQYSEHPEQALLGMNTPLETGIWNKALGTNYSPTVNMFGGPSEQTYANAQREGVDLSAGRAADSVAPAAAGVVGGVFGGPAGGMAAYQGANAVGQMGRQSELNQMQAKGLPAYQAQGYAKGGLASANKQIEQTQIMKVFEHYFQNLGVDVNQGMKNLQKEISQGLQLIPFESSVMGYKPLNDSVAQIHFFTVGTLKDLTDDMQYFYKYLKNKGVTTVYDTLPAPVTIKMLIKLGAKVVESDNPKYKLKATI